MPARIIIKYGAILLGCFLFIGACLLKVVDTPFNASFFWGFKYLSLPITALVVSFVWYYRDVLITGKTRPSRVYIGSILVCGLLVSFSGPYASLVNIFFGPHPLVTYGGRVIDMSETQGRRSHNYFVTILTDGENKPMKFKVSSTEYSELDIGSHFSRTMKIGCLGIPYRLNR